MNHSTCALATNLDEVERAREGVVGVVGAQDRERLAHGLRLLRASLRPLLELLVRHLARLLQVHQELLVRRQGVAGVFEVLVSKRYQIGTSLSILTILLSILSFLLEIPARYFGRSLTWRDMA